MQRPRFSCTPLPLGDRPTDVWSLAARSLFLLGLITYVGLISVGLASANVVERPHFRIPGFVVLWTDQGVRIDDKLTIRLNDAPTSHVSHTTQLRRGFAIASNTGFQIEAVLDQVFFEDADDQISIRFWFEAPDKSSRAQHPHSTEAGFPRKTWSPIDLRSRKLIFKGDRKTAARPGQPRQQAVLFVVEFSTPSPVTSQLEDLVSNLRLTLLAI